MPNSSNKDVNFTFRVDAGLKNAFIDAARAADRSASLLLRDYMREYVRDELEREAKSRPTSS
jgi:predicted transcriptional regulator